MICKECGAYNPDHATYCKVCAANLKGEQTVESHEVREDDPQPTKRFSRPSWVVPEQTGKASETIKEEVEAFNQAEEKAETVEEVVSEIQEETEEVQNEVEEQEEEIWTPAPAKHVAKRREVVEEDDEDEDEDDEDEDLPDDEDETQDVYNDEEMLDQDDDSFEYEPTPPKRKTKKKKNNTLFTILLIAIIVVIVCILVAGGLFLLSTKGVLKCTGNSFSALTNCFGAKKSTTVTTPAPDDDPNATSGTPSDPKNTQPTETDATLEEYTSDEGVDMIGITVLVPSKATITIDFPHQKDWVKTNNEDVAKLFKANVEAAVFYRNEPIENAEQEFTPSIKLETQDGSVYDINCPSFTRTFSPLSITLTAPIANEDGTIMAAENNVVHIEGKVNEDTGVTMMINDQETKVYEGGVFMYDYTMTGTEKEDIVLTASKNNFVSASTKISVDPYVFVPEKMTLEVKDDIASLRADNSGKLTVTGTTLPGATLTAASDNQDSVFCGTVTVDADGKFSFQVTMDTAFYGISTITLDATKEGAEDGSTTFVVSRAYKDYDEFKKAYRKAGGYREINGSDKKVTISIPEMLANPTVYATNNYGYRIFATVQEVIEEEDAMYVKMTAAKTNEVIYVKNMSAKWMPKDNIGSKYCMYCNYIGTYKDTDSILLIGWFCVKDKK